MDSKPPFKWVEIPGLGRAGIQGVSQFQLSRRYTSYTDANDKRIPAEAAKFPIHKVIDQLCESEGKLMFTDADFADVAAIDASILGPIIEQIDLFNEEHYPN